MTAFSACLGLALALAPQGKAPNAPRVAPYDSAWTREAWTADEAPYLAVRRALTLSGSRLRGAGTRASRGYGIRWESGANQRPVGAVSATETRSLHDRR